MTIPGACIHSISICNACVAGKGKLVSLKSITHTPKKTCVLKKGDLYPRYQVRTDQYDYRVKSRLPCIKGKGDLHKMLSEGTLFVDHASGYVRVYNQVSLSTADTVHSKTNYEHEAADLGITINQYHGDNGVYKSQIFMDDLDKHHQTMSLSGVRANEKNGVAERAIQTVLGSARTMMLHQALLWPTYFDMRLWPFSLDNAIYL